MVKIIEYQKDNIRLYKFRLYVGDGRYIKRTGFTSIKQARNEAINIKSQVLKGTYFKPKATKVNDVFNEWFKLYCKTVRESTAATLINCYSNHIKGKIGNKSIKSLDVRTLQKVVNDLSTETTSRELFRKYISIIDRVLRYAIRQDIIQDNPLNKVITPRIQEPKKPLNCYNKQQLKTLLSYLKHEESLQDYMLFKTLAYTGLRIGELIALTWQDIDFIKGTIDINKTVSIGYHGKVIITDGKTESSNRTITLDKETIQELKHWKQEQAKELLKCGYNAMDKKQLVFSNRYNRHLEKNIVNKKLYTYSKACNLPKITPHGLRHTHATLLFESGASIKQVQARLGHRNARITIDIYTHITKDKRDEIPILFAAAMN